MRKSARKFCFGLLFFIPSLAPAVRAANFEIISQKLDDQRHGYTVIRVWGNHRQMGWGLGEAFAIDILKGLDQVKSRLGNYYQAVRTVVADTRWLATGILDELDGIVEGIKAIQPSAQVDRADLMVVLSYGDWGYYGGCRSHQCWGSFVQGATRTLSTRRLDFGTPFDMVLHHAIIAFDPDDGSERWVNLAWPGYVTVVTGVNAHGTLVSLHDYGTKFQIISGGVLRCVATRHVLTDVPVQLPLSQHLGWAENELGAVTFTTGTFINYYVPEGLGGVFTCTTGGSCGQARTPQPEYLNGEVLITTNSQTDGKTVPAGGEFMNEYYRQGKPKTLQDHFELMGTDGLHLLSVDYRGKEDMTLWFLGRGMEERVEVEWKDIFPVSPGSDGGETEPDGGVDDADGGPKADAGADAVTDEAGADEDGGVIKDDGESAAEGCSCASCFAGMALPVSLLLALVALRKKYLP